MSDPLPPHTSANSPMPQPADSSDGSAVARWAAQEKIASTAGGRSPRNSANVRSSSKASRRARTSAGVSPGAGSARRWYLATARCTFRPGREGEPLAHRQREPKGIALDAAAGEQRRADGEAHHAAGHRGGLEPAVAGHRANERSRRGEEMRAVVHPVLAAGLGAQTAAQPVLRLQEQDIAVAQPPCRRQTGDPPADDNHLAIGHGLMMLRSIDPS
jgi:hypothetical protein